MIVFAIGDVVGSQGCEFVRRHLSSFKKLNKIDLCIANGENSAKGNGITPESARHLLDSGVDIITTGNHVYRRREVYDLLDTSRNIIRPANFYKGNPGSGYEIADMGFTRAAVINLMGKVDLNPDENPFTCIDRILEEVSDCPVKLVDFHAEATSEKRAMGFYLDGRVSALFGTHTHVQTADAQILEKGTGYITDLGMTGPKQSVIGISPEISINWQKTGMPARFDVPDLPCMMCGCIFEIDDKTGKTVSVQSVTVE
ncbi:MAG: TIGR00282 family metallophosphoesterase [Clostridiales bacterium]|nr:TIGR00282 family metallophosphoesterase [Clostridiales bacterium]